MYGFSEYYINYMWALYKLDRNFYDYYIERIGYIWFCGALFSQIPSYEYE